MKTFMRAVMAATAVMSAQVAWADIGPYYVSYAGYCNVEKVYINSNSDVYGTEVGCTAALGKPLIGTFTVDGRVIVSQTGGSGQPCVAVYGTDGSLRGGCSTGGSVIYNANARYTVQEAGRAGNDAKAITYVVSTEMPDISKTKELPELP